MLYVQKIVYPELINSGPGNVWVKEAKTKTKTNKTKKKTKNKNLEKYFKMAKTTLLRISS